MILFGELSKSQQHRNLCAIINMFLWMSFRVCVFVFEREEGLRCANPCNPKVVVNKEALQSTELG